MLNRHMALITAIKERQIKATYGQREGATSD
jgi:hypothetical protein